jgi:hypothetical protein
VSKASTSGRATCRPTHWCRPMPGNTMPLTGAEDLNLAFADVRVLLHAFPGTDPTARRSLGRSS